MAKKTGICMNLDCDNYKKEVEIEPGGEFECPLCHQPLKEGRKTGGNVPDPGKKKGMMIVGGLAVAAVAAVGIYYGITPKDTDSTDAPKKDSIAITVDDNMEVEDVNVTSMTFMETAKDMQLKPDETRQLNIDCRPGNANEAVTWKSGNEAVATVSASGLVKAVSAGRVTITAVTDRSKTKAEIEVTVSDKGTNSNRLKSSKGTIDLGYGSYTGELKNGKPHGYGTITYKTSTKIVPSKDFIANPGDTFEGDFRDGKISGLGYWTHDGNQTAVKP